MTIVANTTKELIERKARNAADGSIEGTVAIDLTYDNQVVIVSKYSKGYRPLGLKTLYSKREVTLKWIEELNAQLFKLSPMEAQIMAIQAL